ncbi:MAG: hypothetical protein ACR2L4_02765 [Actinomycetota bacterium]
MAAQDDGRLYRYRWSCQILYGHYTNFMELQREKNAIAKLRGWSTASFWIATAGGLNDFFLEREYPSLGLLAGELEAREMDIDFMKAMRESYQYVVQGSVRIELFETPA